MKTFTRWISRSSRESARVVLVLGAKQSKLPTEFAMQAQLFGDRFAYVRIDVPQPNGVDFCIAFYLVEYLARHPDADCVILSRDKKGFDPLVQHLVKQRQLRVRRVNSQAEAFPTARAKSAAIAGKNGAGAVDDYERVLSLLQKDKARPRKRKGIEGKLKSWLPLMQDQARAEFLDRLFADGHVSETNGSLTYQSARGDSRED
jgi:hypothetical protein